MNQTDELLALNKLLQKGLIDEEDFIRLKNELLLKKKTDNQPKLIRQSPNGLLFVLCCVLLFFALLMAYYIWSNQSTNTSVHYSNATDRSSNSLETPPTYLSYSFPSKLLYTYEYGSAAQTECYPIGWSHDGKFAYVSMNPASLTGKQKLTLYIQDMVSDKFVEKSESSTHFESQEINRQRAWTKMQNTFSELLKQHAI
ncbi:MAG: hypothetical protein ACKO5C_02055 [Ferruginibacter sp.]